MNFILNELSLHGQFENVDEFLESLRANLQCFQLGERMGLERDECLKARYAGTRVDCSMLEKEYGAKYLEKDEYHLLLGTLDKLVKHESWETIALDTGMESVFGCCGLKEIIKEVIKDNVRKKQIFLLSRGGPSPCATTSQTCISTTTT